MAVAEQNAKGGVLGRKIETVHVDTETTPATVATCCRWARNDRAPPATSR